MVATVPLPPNTTYPYRQATFIPMASPTGMVGVVEIRECRVPDGKAKCSRYALRRDVVDGAVRVRFTKPGGLERYHVDLPADPTDFPVCECTGYLHGGWCKHLETVFAFQAAGFFHPQPVPGEPDRETDT